MTASGGLLMQRRREVRWMTREGALDHLLSGLVLDKRSPKAGGVVLDAKAVVVRHA